MKYYSPILRISNSIQAIDLIKQLYDFGFRVYNDNNIVAFQNFVEGYGYLSGQDPAFTHLWLYDLKSLTQYSKGIFSCGGYRPYQGVMRYQEYGLTVVNSSQQMLDFVRNKCLNIPANG